MAVLELFSTSDHRLSAAVASVSASRNHSGSPERIEAAAPDACRQDAPRNAPMNAVVTMAEFSEIVRAGFSAEPPVPNVFLLDLAKRNSHEPYFTAQDQGLPLPRLNCGEERSARLRQFAEPVSAT